MARSANTNCFVDRRVIRTHRNNRDREIRNRLRIFVTLILVFVIVVIVPETVQLSYSS